MSETWVPVPGVIRGYEISSQGRVRSVDRVTLTTSGHARCYRGHVITPARHVRGGYLFVNLSVDGRQHHRKVHALVCEAFNGEKPDSATLVRHLDGNIYNNTPSNLQWGTASENLNDAVRHGTHANTAKSLCKRGHPLCGENLYINPSSGSRQCRMCAAIHRANYSNRKANES
nr:MAG TPA_asm: homing endonuclease [Caudoviricetes sp.]